MTTSGHGNGLLRWKIATAVGVTLGAVACLLYVIGESPLTAQRRVEAVDGLSAKIGSVHVAIAELKASIAEWKAGRP